MKMIGIGIGFGIGIENGIRTSISITIPTAIPIPTPKFRAVSFFRNTQYAAEPLGMLHP